MKFNVGCWRLGPVTLVTVTSLLSACTTASFDPVIWVCPPVVEYDVGFQARAAEEVLALPDGSAFVEMLSDYAVMREQAQVCDFP